MCILFDLINDKIPGTGPYMLIYTDFRGRRPSSSAKSTKFDTIHDEIKRISYVWFQVNAFRDDKPFFLYADKQLAVSFKRSLFRTDS
jgi:hypothetical protein